MNKYTLHTLGLHPLVALGMIVVDLMLFGPDATGVGWMVSCSIAAVLTAPCIIMQRYAYKDSWLVAISKGVILGVITAIPSPLPSLLTGIGGIAGFLRPPDDRNSNALD
ncbi:MAG: hypothetical protein JW808_00240 [Victivallales bacterium]|nr:hypothetical protein [Victivallales bacterium]